jgi:hypothetical protein
LSALRIPLFKSLPRHETHFLWSQGCIIIGKMDGVPVSGLVELENHMQQLIEAPDTQVNAKLFDDVELQLTGMFFCYEKKVWILW